MQETGNDKSTLDILILPLKNKPPQKQARGQSNLKHPWSPRLVWFSSSAKPQAAVSSQVMKTGLCLSFYRRKGQQIQDQSTTFAFCADLPREGRGAIYHHHSLCVSCRPKACPVPSAWWPVLPAASAEGWDVCPCLLFLKTQSGPEQLETLVFYVPLAPCCLMPARRVHWLLFISVTNALIYL